MSALVGENAQFHCSGSGFTIIWTVDEYSASESIIMARGITQSMVTSSDTIQSTLTVPAILENNGTTVQCVIYPGEVTSNNATLTVLPGELMLAAILHSEIHVCYRYWSSCQCEVLSTI